MGNELSIFKFLLIYLISLSRLVIAASFTKNKVTSILIKYLRARLGAYFIIEI